MRAYFEAQGTLLVLRVINPQKRRNFAVSTRGRVRSFSAQSRRRLLRFMARLKAKGVRATFMTLTFKGYPSNAEAKRCLHAFLQVLRTKFVSASAVWRMEYQGRGSIHFHMLVFNLPYWDWKEVLATWKRISHQSKARIDIRQVRSRRGVQSYVSKYIAKVERRVKKTFLVYVPYLHAGRKWRKGRFWGYHNKKLLPLGQKFTGVLTEGSLITRLSKAAWEIIGFETKYASISFHLFHDHAVSLWEMYMAKGGLDMSEYKNSLIFDHHYGYHFRDIGAAFVI
jgi:hypothetical protein